MLHFELETAPQKTRARKKYKRLIHNASETVGTLDFLCKYPRSKARSNATNVLKPTHIMAELITPPERANEDEFVQEQLFANVSCIRMILKK